jgi:predicted Rossmann fold flavoprotein
LHPRPRTLELICNFLPSLTVAQLDAWLRDLATTDGKKQITVLLTRFLPRRLADALAEQAGIPAERRATELSRGERAALVQMIKATILPVTGTLGWKKAEVTAGGVALDEIDSRTMQSKLVPNLLIAGELLDLDGPIGGYNFQAAFSTGWLAGENT